MFIRKLYLYFRPVLSYISYYGCRTFFGLRKKVMSTEETLKYILDNKVSVSRYGDGELGIIRNYDIGFQRSSSKLRERLIEVATKPIDNHICCVPFPIAHIEKSLKREQKKWWIDQIGLLYGIWNRYFKSQTIIGDTQISRFYMDYRNDKIACIAINQWKQIWKDRDILIVEGENTRLGVGNDLFNSARSIRRILCPEADAFSSYDEILNNSTNYSLNYDKIGGGKSIAIIGFGTNCYSFSL